MHRQGHTFGQCVYPSQTGYNCDLSLYMAFYEKDAFATGMCTAHFSEEIEPPGGWSPSGHVHGSHVSICSPGGWGMRTAHMSQYSRLMVGRRLGMCTAHMSQYARLVVGRRLPVSEEPDMPRVPKLPVRRRRALRQRAHHAQRRAQQQPASDRREERALGALVLRTHMRDDVGQRVQRPEARQQRRRLRLRRQRCSY